MIQVTALQKSYGSLQAVSGVSFDISRGETFGLLGPNGAGKSTTIHIMAGLLRPDGGQVTINGATDPTKQEVRRQIGFAPQALALYEDLTAEENLRFFGKLYGIRGAKLSVRVSWALEFAGLADRRSDALKVYSGGMKRRLNFAAALIHDPPVLFLDEPTAGVDPQSRNHLFNNIEKLSKEGRTILYTTHYMEEAERLCQRVAVMDHGKVLALDSVDKLIDRFGGQSVVEAELKAGSRSPDQWRQTLATALGDAAYVLEGRRLRLDSARPLEAVAKLAAGGVELTTLRVDRPDLETVFLALTGRRLRD
jgi:ABC-2 type transport system ATP-binding protein